MCAIHFEQYFIWINVLQTPTLPLVRSYGAWERNSGGSQKTNKTMASKGLQKQGHNVPNEQIASLLPDPRGPWQLGDQNQLCPIDPLCRNSHSLL